jgi:hypothetical protein
MERAECASPSMPILDGRFVFVLTAEITLGSHLMVRLCKPSRPDHSPQFKGGMWYR